MDCLVFSMSEHYVNAVFSFKKSRYLVENHRSLIPVFQKTGILRNTIPQALIMSGEKKAGE
ncbi:CLUMA_CG002767, isoform A [Clunio marinus]|uniref:CLUMA_CG002767, isoform A n=1 Tax=Clunio marinus TaxID=568069 RepID=A0A1J1HNA0_9DIPT|nr:CLUMA_CG002767, isoform A [Clunio marinus]